VQAMVTLLSVHGCLSHRKIGQLFSDLYGYELNGGTTQAMVERSAAQMPLETLKAGLRRAGVAHFDETSLRVGGQLWWLHNASTKDLTYQFVHEKRGGAALTSEKSVWPEFGGIAVHDCWASYFGLGEMRHALCNAHIIRELTGLIENSQSQWAAQMKELLLSLYQHSDCGHGVIAEMRAAEAGYRAILRSGEEEEPPPQRTHAKGKLKRTKGRNLLERLSKYQEEVLRFAKIAEVPFTNNQAERDIRPVKVKQKVSGGFRAHSGAESYTRIYSFISTLRKLKRQVFSELRCVIEGRPFVLSQT
jgi:transposase